MGASRAARVQLMHSDIAARLSEIAARHERHGRIVGVDGACLLTILVHDLARDPL